MPEGSEMPFVVGKDQFVANIDLAAIRVFQTSHAAQQGRLTAARRTQQGQNVPGSMVRLTSLTATTFPNFLVRFLIVIVVP